MSSYQSEWERCRRRRKKFIILLVAEFLAFIPFVALVVGIERKLLSTSHLGMPAASVWGMLYGYTIFHSWKFPCPRCGKNFAGKMGGPQVLSGRRCAYCGLPLYA